MSMHRGQMSIFNRASIAVPATYNNWIFHAGLLQTRMGRSALESTLRPSGYSIGFVSEQSAGKFPPVTTASGDGSSLRLWSGALSITGDNLTEIPRRQQRSRANEIRLLFRLNELRRREKETFFLRLSRGGENNIQFLRVAN